MSFKDDFENKFNDLFGAIDEPEVEDTLDNIINLTDEDGNDVPFEFLDLIGYRGKEYVVLFPVEDDGTGEVVILEVENAGSENECLVSVEDMDVLNALFEIFKEKFKDEFNFVD